MFDASSDSGPQAFALVDDSGDVFGPPLGTNAAKVRYEVVKCTETEWRITALVLDTNGEVLLAVQAEGGRAFVTEFAGPSSEVLSRILGNGAGTSAEVLDALSTGTYVTRLSTLIAPEDMIVDPIFELRTDLPDVTNTHSIDLRNDPAFTTVTTRDVSLGFAAAVPPGLAAVAFFLLLRTTRRRMRR